MKVMTSYLNRMQEMKRLGKLKKNSRNGVLSDT